MNSTIRRMFGGVGVLVLAGASACDRTGADDAFAQTRSASEQMAGTTQVETADTAAAYALSSAFRAASERALPAVVFVRVERSAMARAPSQLPVPEELRRFFQFDPQQPMPPQGNSGSGFIIEESGLAVTNHHVIEGASRITVRLQDGREYVAELVGSDANTDVALIRIDAEGEDLPVIPGWVDSDRTRVGDWVLALGNPLGYDFTVTAGIVSAMGRQLSVADEYALESYIQTDAAINPGNSGGPLVDLAGRVVGVNTAIGGSTRFVGYSFAVPSNLVQRVIEDLQEYGHVRRPRLGVRVQPVTAVDAEVFQLDRVAGAKVFSVEEGTPAEEAGLEAGDVILTLDGEPIETATELTTELAQHHPGERVTIGYVRDGRRAETTATLAEFEQNGRNARSNVASRNAPAERIGFSVQPLTASAARELGYSGTDGVIVASVVPFSPAANAGVLQGLLVRSINGNAVEDVDDFQAIAADVEAGETVSLRAQHPEYGEIVINYRAR